MKLLRLIAIAFAAVLVLVAIAVVAIFQPSVQTRLVQSFLTRPGSMAGKVGWLHAGWKMTEWRDLQLRGNGWTLNMPHARAEVPAVGAIQHDVHVHSFTAHGWTLDLSAPTATSAQVAIDASRLRRWNRLPLAAIGFAQVTPTIAPAPTGTAVFRGIFPLLDLPVDLAVDQVDLDGVVLLRSQTGGPVERIHIVITGGGLAAGQSGRFLVSGETAVNMPAMPVSSVRAQMNVQARLATPRRFDLLQIDGHLNSENGKAAGPRLFLNASIRREGDHESYGLSVRAGEAANSPELIQAQADFPDNQGRVSGHWKADTNDAQFSPFLLGALLPSFSMKGTGKFDADSAFQEVHAAGNFSGQMARWETITPTLGSLGSLQLDGSFDVLQNGQTLRIEQLAVQVADANPIFSVTALQGIEFDAETAEVR
ncbi:MAG TPA: hypothetical protein VIM69_13360, partial [Opitutaceae bacterium]